MVCAKNEIPYGYEDELNFTGLRNIRNTNKEYYNCGAMRSVLILGTALMMTVGIARCMTTAIRWKKELNSQLTICSMISATSA